MDIYETVSGDTWDLIAYKTMGNEKYAKEFIEANPEHIYTVVFSAGLKIKIPEIPSPTNTSLPPWKRGAMDAGA